MNLAQVNQYGGLHFSQKDMSDAPERVTIDPASLTGEMAIENDPPGENLEVEDVLLVLGYEWEP